jgi:hypothetical protein
MAVVGWMDEEVQKTKFRGEYRATERQPRFLRITTAERLNHCKR